MFICLVKFLLDLVALILLAGLRSGIRH